MNERLKQLMQEAGYAAPEIASRANKLAELIVQECINIAYEYDKPKLSGPGLAIASNIESHFDIYIEEDGRFVK
jgi:hypothetical protein